MCSPIPPADIIDRATAMNILGITSTSWFEELVDRGDIVALHTGIEPGRGRQRLFDRRAVATLAERRADTP